MTIINPWINFNGNAEEAFTFYKSVFGGAFSKVVRFKDLASAGFPVAEHEANKIMHIALPIGKSTLMANDVPEMMGRTNENENRSKIVITAESMDEANKLFNGHPAYKYGILPGDMQNGVTGGIVEGEGFEPSMTGALIYLNGGDDLSVPLSKVEAAGGKILLPKTSIGGNGFMAHIADTEGNRIALHSMN